MKSKLIQRKLQIKPSSVHGYGVFAGEALTPETIIEECHTLICTQRSLELTDYYFSANDQHSIPLGFGCIYNHADQPNARYFFDEERCLIVFQAISPISEGEEIFISYGNDWFTCRALEKRKKSVWHRLWQHWFWRAWIVIGAIVLFIKMMKS